MSSMDSKRCVRYKLHRTKQSYLAIQSSSWYSEVARSDTDNIYTEKQIIPTTVSR
ncbi:predicted protein [Botrytis cinerea T4]|uniref:Uncharacterized protein n=1 Tax=Botryotinia fuckeliana (strain T4) TaxID=999810 RepID=G2YZ51_BOTF4|nr:predicted protein [Botrytis cinerea T4]